MFKPELVDRAIAAIKGYAQYQYFFDQLDSPEWLEPLAARNFFKEPPPPEKVDPYVRLPFWPESRYLVRMAAIPEAQASVVRIARDIPKTENSRVYDDILDVALALPAVLAAQLVDQIAIGVQLPIKLALQHRIGDLIQRLAVGGQGADALRLTSLILDIAPGPRAERQDEDPTWLHPEPQPLIREWYYSRTVEKSLSALVQAVGLDAVRLFVDLLDDAIRLSRKATQDTSDEEDHVYMCCPAIEHGHGEGRDDLVVILIGAVRDATEELLAADPAQFAAVITLLDSKHWVTFRRLKVHLCRVFPQPGLAIAEAMLSNPEILLRGSLQHEIVLLLKSTFVRFSGEAQQRILSIMDAGVSEDALRRWLEFAEQPVTQENIRRLADIGRRDRYATLQGQLPPNYQRKLDELITSLGEPRTLGEPKIASFRAVHAQSPKTDAEMEAMSVEDILDFAASWTAGTHMFEPTPEGLGKALTSRLAKDPASFIAHAKRFEALDPTYVRAFFGGVQSALKAKATFDWQPVLELAAWVVRQSREIPGRKSDLTSIDPDWGWTRDGILDLLTEGFDLDVSGHLPHDVHPLVWGVLQSLTVDPNPATADEGGEGFDPGFLSINSTRGRAFHTALEYARWRYLVTEPDRKAEAAPRFTFDEMPEVRDLLEAHLDVNREPTLTIRSVYGHHLNLIAALDFDWLRANLDRIFPADDPPRFAAAWDDYITSNEPNVALLPSLIPFLQRAVRRLGQDEPKKQHRREPAEALAEHLMVYYWSDRIDFDTPDQLLREFYEQAPDAVRGHAIWFIGTSVPEWTDAPPQVYAHLQDLFRRRLSVAKALGSRDSFQKELTNFGTWFTSEKFDERWSVDMLLGSLEIANRAEPGMSVVKRLADLCPRYPVECVFALRAMIEGDRDGWLLLGVEHDARRVLKGAIDSNNEPGVNNARRLIEDLIAKGQFGFRQLLS